MISLIEVYLSSRQELRWFEAQKGVLTMAGHLMRLKIHASWCPPFKRSSQQKQAERKEIPLLSASWKRSQHRLWDGCSAAPPVASKYTHICLRHRCVQRTLQGPVGPSTPFSGPLGPKPWRGPFGTRRSVTELHLFRGVSVAALASVRINTFKIKTCASIRKSLGC